MNQHRYGDPCKTCGEPAYDYNVPKCSSCKQVEENNGTSPLQKLYMPGLAGILAELRR